MNKYKLLMVVAEAAVCYAALAVVAGCRHVPDGNAESAVMFSGGRTALPGSPCAAAPTKAKLLHEVGTLALFSGETTADIAGSRFEWHNRKSKQFTLLKGKGESRHPCCFTDDTVMTLAVADAILKWREGGDGSYSSLSVAAVKSMQAFGLLYPYAGYGGASHGNMRRTFRFGFCNGS